MSLYKAYLELWKSGAVCAGFSPRLPDYAARYWLEQLEHVLPQRSQGGFLDIGAGDGRLSLLLLRRFSVRGTAIEVQINRTAWQPIQDRYGHFELKEGMLQDVMNHLVGKQTFDFILLAEVFEHIPPNDVKAFLQRLLALLSPQGKIFLTTPNCIAQGPAETSHMWHERQPYGHYKHYTYAELQQILHNAGFVVERLSFECHGIKRKLYNTFFYPISRLDARLMQTKKLPAVVRWVYRFGSAPFIWGIRFYFKGLGRFVYAVEKRLSNEKNASTMIVIAQKK